MIGAGNIVKELQRLNNTGIEAVWTMVPAIVLAVDRPNCRCDVRLKILTQAGTVFAPLKNVPVVMPRGLHSLILMPISVGDVVLVGFCNYSMNAMLINEQEKRIGTESKFSLNGAVVLGGFVLDKEVGTTIFGSAKYELPTSGIVIVSDQKVNIVAPEINIAEPGVNDNVLRKSDALSVVGNTGAETAGTPHTHPISINITVGSSSSKVKAG